MIENKVHLVNPYEEIRKKHGYRTRSCSTGLNCGEHWEQCLLELPEFLLIWKSFMES